MRNKNLLKIDSRHPSVQTKVLADGFGGNREFMDDYRLLEKGGLEAFRGKKPRKTKIEETIDETVFRNELRKELKSPYTRSELQLGAAAAAELAEVVPIKEQVPEEVALPSSGESVVGYIIEDPREKTA